MATLKLKVLPQFPSQVLGGDGVIVTRAACVWTISLGGSLPATFPTLTVGSESSLNEIGTINSVGIVGFATTAYGTQATIVGRRANGTQALPTQVLSGDNIFVVSARGYHSGGAFPTSGDGAVRVVAAENFTNTARGTHFDVLTTPVGTAAVAQAMRVHASGGMAVGTTPVDLGANNLYVQGTGDFGVTTALDRLGIINSVGLIGLANTNYAVKANIILRRADGTQAAPTALGANQVIAAIGFRGYTGSSFTDESTCILRAVSNQIFTPTAMGTYFDIFTTPDGSIIPTQAVRVHASNGVYIGGTPVDPGINNLTVEGLIKSAGHHPVTDDVGALGTTALRWADLFLAPGAVINIGNGDATITHATDKLSFEAAATGYGFSQTALNARDFNATVSAVGTICYSGTNYGNQVAYEGRRANGTQAAPTKTLSGQVLSNYIGKGYQETTSAFSAGGIAQIRFVAIEDFTSTAQGARVELMSTPAGSVTTAVAATMHGSTGFSVGTGTDPGAGAMLANTSIKSQGATAGIGYATGAGGAVTQLTSRTTGVTLDKVAGAITLFSAAGSTTPASFTVTNSAVAATDVVMVSQKSGTDLYETSITAVAAGSFRITFNTTGGTTTEQPVFNFAVIKAVAA